MQFFGISIYFLIDCTEKSVLCLFCATKVVIICAKIWHSLQQNVEIVNGGGKNQQGARKNTSLLVTTILCSCFFHFFCLTKRNERQRKVKTVAAALPKICRFGVG